MNLQLAKDVSAFHIREALPEEVQYLQEIDILSNQLFEGTGLLDLSEGSVHIQPIPDKFWYTALAEGFLWTAADAFNTPIGFALASHRDEDLYLDQLSVLPEHGQRGIGTQLVQTVLEHADLLNFKRVSLSTFKDVPWNAPFYKKLGFKVIPPRRWQNWQMDIIQRQSATMDITKRCLMQKPVKRLFG